MGCAAVGKTGNFHEAYVLGTKVWQADGVQVRVAKRAYDEQEAACHQASQADISVRIVSLRGLKSFKDRRDTVDPQLRKRAQHEAHMWSKVGQHENIVRLLEVILEGPMMYMVTEPCDYGILYILERMPLLNEQTLARFFRDGLKALQHVHKQGIVHGDVRLDNFFVSGSKFVLKLTGFGAAAQLPSDKSLLYTTSGHVPYMSPEMLSGAGYEFKTDVWSLGVVVYLLFYGRFPYKPKEKTAESMREAIIKNEPPPAFEPWMATQRDVVFTDAAMEFLTMLLRHSVAERPTAGKALESNYLEQADSTDARGVALEQKLLPMLCGALRCGAFVRLTSKEEETDIDTWVNLQQSPYHGPISPWTPLRPHASILKAAMEASHTPASMEEPDAIQALRKIREGDVAQQLGTIMRGDGERKMEGEFSIALGDLRRMRKGDGSDELHRFTPAKSEERSRSATRHSGSARA
mmetsp:Transcript_25342/g.46414  ORF Transcript_25342/g.46414 Transcript_25342/m.46414 type:complete len:464 (+) Transcript_25342:1-1392(+)